MSPQGGDSALACDRMLGVDDLVVFLLARIDERRMAATNLIEMRATVRGEQQSRMAPSVKEGAEAVFDSAQMQPARILRAFDAQRRIVEAAQEEGTVFAHEVLRLLAVPFDDHADYREEWRP